MVDRSQYLQEWTFEPEQRIPADAPQPWYVAGYAFKAVDNVLRVDYLAVRVRNPRSVYEVPGGKLEYIGHAEELRGRPVGVGTLFVLWPPGIEVGATLGQIIDEAQRRGIAMADLKSGKARQED